MPDPVVLREAMPFVKERMNTLRDAPSLLRFLFTDDLALNDKAQGLVAKAPDGYLATAADALEAVEPWDAETIHESLNALAAEQELSTTKAFQPIRAAVTGSNVSPPLPESLGLLGKKRTLTRLRSVVAG